MKISKILIFLATISTAIPIVFSVTFSVTTSGTVKFQCIFQKCAGISRSKNALEFGEIPVP